MTMRTSMELSYHSAKSAMEGLLLVGAAIMALGYGLKRVYNTAKSVDELLTLSKTSARERVEIANALAAQSAREDARDHQMADLTNKVNTIFREVLPNGGSSMKDVVNQTNLRVAVLEQWQKDHEDV